MTVGTNNENHFKRRKSNTVEIATLARNNRYKRKKVEQTNCWKKGLKVEGTQYESKISRVKKLVNVNVPNI